MVPELTIRYSGLFEAERQHDFANRGALSERIRAS